MKSIKPGRGPSKMSAAASVIIAIFGVFWCVAAAYMGAWFMIPFGLCFVALAIYQAVYHKHNATAEDRYSVIDIVDENEEPDPLNNQYGKTLTPDSGIYYDYTPDTGTEYCPYCGKPTEGDFTFCPKCGRKLPE